MKVIVGTRNPIKVQAVEELLAEYPHLAGAEIVGVDVPSGVSDQPRTLEEVTLGATNRAKAAFVDCDYAIGLEAGFFAVPHSKSGYMNISAAVIYDGTDAHLGLSSVFETPDPEIMRLVVEEGMALNEAAIAVGFTHNPEIAKQEGVVGMLTKGRVNRKEYLKESLRMALLHIEK